MKSFWQEFRSTAVARDRAAATLLLLFALIGVSSAGAGWLLCAAPVQALDAQEQTVSCPSRSQGVCYELGSLNSICEIGYPTWCRRPSLSLLSGGFPEPRAPDRI